MSDAPNRQEQVTEYAKKVADLFIQAMQDPTPNAFNKPWVPGEGFQMFANYNGASGKPYNGSNQLYLTLLGLEAGYQSNVWLTFAQAKALGGRVRKGEKSTEIRFFKKNPNADVAPVEGEEDKYRGPIVSFARVFNRSQIEGLPEEGHASPKSEQWKHEACEKVIQECGVPIIHGQRDRAFYSPSKDEIHLPHKHQFKSEDAYYATVLHELGHSTGHHTRLDRNLRGAFGSAEYAREELRAEIASMMMGQRLDIGHDLGQHTAYVAHWAEILAKDPKEILRACADAEKICYTLGVHAQHHERVNLPEPTQEQQSARDKAVQEVNAMLKQPKPQKTKERTRTSRPRQQAQAM